MWGAKEIERLQGKHLLPGDNVYKVVFALGTPARIVWDNDFEILVFKDDTAAIFENGLFSKRGSCKSCSKKNINEPMGQGKNEGEFEVPDGDVIELLSLNSAKK